MLCIAGFLGATWTASKISKCLCLEYDGIWEGKSKGDFPMKLAFILDILEMDWTIQHFLVPPCIWRMGHVWVCTDRISRGIGWGGPNFYTYTYIFYIVHVDEQFELLLRHLESAWSNFFFGKKNPRETSCVSQRGWALWNIFSAEVFCDSMPCFLVVCTAKLVDEVHQRGIFFWNNDASGPSDMFWWGIPSASPAVSVAISFGAIR